MNNDRITFRRLRKTDLPLMFRWLNTPHVNKWYTLYGKKSPSQEDVRRKYSPRINGEDPTTCYLIIYDGLPIGMVQSCRLDDYPLAKTMFDLNENAAGIDIFIGEGDYVHRGLGNTIIKKFLKEVVFINYDVACCIVDPDPKNQVAVKSYSKVGFKYVKTIWNQEDAVYAYIMSINRDEVCPGKGV